MTVQVPMWNRVVAFLTFGSGTVAIAYALRLGLDPAMYFPGYDVRRPAPFHFPLSFFAMTCGLMLIYTITAFIGLVRIRWPMWLRCLIVLAILIPWTFYISRIFLHMPGFWAVQLFYLWALVLVIISAFVLSAVSSLIRNLRSRRPTHA